MTRSHDLAPLLIYDFIDSLSEAPHTPENSLIVVGVLYTYIVVVDSLLSEHSMVCEPVRIVYKLNTSN